MSFRRQWRNLLDSARQSIGVVALRVLQGLAINAGRLSPIEHRCCGAASPGFSPIEHRCRGAASPAWV